jgi:hypothetical protein
MENDLRRWMRLVENEDRLSMEPVGTIVTLRSGDGFAETHLDYMKMASGEWHQVASDGGDRGVPIYRYLGTPIEIGILRKALEDGRLTRPIEGIKPGDTLRVGAQVHALPDGAVIVNPQIRRSMQDPNSAFHQTGEGEPYHKQNGKFFKNGKEVPDYAFTPENAMWES